MNIENHLVSPLLSNILVAKGRVHTVPRSYQHGSLQTSNQHNMYLMTRETNSIDNLQYLKVASNCLFVKDRLIIQILVEDPICSTARLSINLVDVYYHLGKQS